MNARSGRHAVLGVLLTGALTLAACGQGEPAPSGTPTPQTTIVPTLTTSTSTTVSPDVLPPTTKSLPPTIPSAPTTYHPPEPSIPTTPTKPATTSPRPTTTTPKPTTTPTTSCSIPSSLLGRDLTLVPTTKKVVALTFDAGGSNAGVSKILNTLSTTGTKATFFLTGAFADTFPSSARAMARYPVGNHTQTHPDLTTLTDSQIRTELRTAATHIKAVTGQDPHPYFRFPFGAVNSHVIGVVNAECYVPFRWTVDTLGWKGTSGGQSVDTVVARVLNAAQPGEIVLMHVGAHPTDGSTLDADALPRIISGLRAKGYGFVTLEAVLPAS